MDGIGKLKRGICRSEHSGIQERRPVDRANLHEAAGNQPVIVALDEFVVALSVWMDEHLR
jgi:hypothetical protein